MIHPAGDDAQFTERHRLVLGPEPDVDGVGDVVHLAGALGGGHSDAARGVGGAVNQSTADRRVGVIATPDEQAGHVETVVRMKVRKQDRHLARIGVSLQRPKNSRAEVDHERRSSRCREQVSRSR